MKNKSSILILILSALISAGCTTVKRYHSVLPKVTDNTVAGIDLFGFRLSESKSSLSGKSLWDLSADAQSQFIKILNGRYPDNLRFREAMNFKYFYNTVDLGSDDYVTKDLRLVFSVSRRHDYFVENLSGVILSPADRIEYLKITLEVPEETPFHFTGWNMYSTEYGTVDIADISFSRSIDLDASAALTTGKDDNKGELSAGGKSSVTRKEDQSLKYRFLKLNGRIGNKKIEMEEEGTRETDLTGNIIADVSLEFDKFPETATVFSGLSDTTGKPCEPDKVSVRFEEVDVPLMEDIEDTIYAEMRLDYLYRNVVNNGKTFPEWDDRIRYINGSVIKKIPILTTKDYVPGFCCIGSASENDERDLITLESPAGKSYTLIFRSYGEAIVFYDWLDWYFKSQGNMDKGIRIGMYIIKYRGSELTGKIFEGESTLRVFPYYLQDNYI